jgi:fructose-1,6-bisphosphatase I
MQEHQTLAEFLAEWSAGEEPRSAVAATVTAIAEACCAIAELIALGPLAGHPRLPCGETADDPAPAALLQRASALLARELRSAPVACLASEESESPDGLDLRAPLCVAVNPLDGAANIDANVAVGTLFSILPMTCAECRPSRHCFVRPGRMQLAAGYVIYGPRTALALTLGAGTHIFTLNPDTGAFCLTAPDCRIPEDTDEFAINTANFRRWDGHIRAYIDDCLKGAEGAHGKNYTARWIASLVAECHRILVRGGICLYPGDRRAEYRSGRLRLAYDCNPIAFLIEQAGGAATTGQQSILDVTPTDAQQRVPLIFGSRDEVRLLEHYYREVRPFQERPQLFGTRDLLRL